MLHFKALGCRGTLTPPSTKVVLALVKAAHTVTTLSPVCVQALEAVQVDSKRSILINSGVSINVLFCNIEHRPSFIPEIIVLDNRVLHWT
jgi:hypothetical protein